MIAPPDVDDDEPIEIEEGELEYGEATDFSPGGMVGRYQLCFELASGGMAKVYLARVGGAAGFDKLVALKRIHPHLADQHGFLEMFMDEARLASRIDHPNVCTVFDFGRAGREHYLAMEYLLGETLGRLARHVDAELARSPRWWAIAMRIVAEASEGLHAAHELRNDAGEPLEVVHRDVTPANVFLTYDGAVKVVDFGVARAQDRVHQTRAGHVKGQYAYMAPEQAKGKELDRRADVWSLGVILWELLAGKRLFERPNEAATLMAVVSGEIPALGAVRPEIPADVEAIVMRTLSADPKRRPATARALARELDRCIARLGEPVGKSDLGDLMERLFATDIVRRKRMIADARRLEAGTVLKIEDSHVTPRVSTTREIDLGDEEEPTQIAFAPSFHPPPVTEPDDVREPIEESSPAALLTPVVHEPARDRRGGRVALVAAVVVLSLVGTVVAIAIRVGDTAPSPAEAPAVAAAGGTPAGTIARTDGAGTAHPEAVAAPGSAADPAPASGGAVADAVADAVGVDGVAAEEVEDAAEDEVATGARTRRPRTRARSPRLATGVARAPGTVNVVTPGGWAEVFLGGRRIGRSPGRIELPAGRHSLELRPFGTEAPRRVSVEVPSGGTARVSVPVSR